MWIGVAAVIWVVVKLPQEWWIHIAKLDLTDELAAHTWASPLLIVVVLGVVALIRYAVVPRMGAPDRRFRLAADPVPTEMDSAVEQAEWRAEHGRVLSWVTLEKVVLVGLLSVIFAQMLPGVRATNLQVFIGVGTFVVVNAAMVLALSRRAMTTESMFVAFAFRMAVNVALLVLDDWLLNRTRGDIDLGDATFFVLLLSLLTTLYDRYEPVHAWRVDRDREEATQPAGRGRASR
jgi:hypothetical protein